MVRKRKRSSCASGSGKVPSYSIGFCVASTRNGRGQQRASRRPRDLALAHRFQQRGLRARRGAVDLVGQQDVGEDGPGHELEAARLLVEDADAGDVAGQQVGRALDAAKVDAEAARPARAPASSCPRRAHPPAARGPRRAGRRPAVRPRRACRRSPARRWRSACRQRRAPPQCRQACRLAFRQACRLGAGSVRGKQMPWGAFGCGTGWPALHSTVCAAVRERDPHAASFSSPSARRLHAFSTTRR